MDSWSIKEITRCLIAATIKQRFLVLFFLVFEMAKNGFVSQMYRNKEFTTAVFSHQYVAAILI